MPDLGKKKFWTTIFWTGLMAGTLDISAALIHYTLTTNNNPARVLRYIASAVFSKKALTGNNSMVLFGLLFHYLIAFSFTILFFLLYPGFFSRLKYHLVTAIVVGLAIWMIMNLVIVPASNAPAIPLTTRGVITNVTILIVAMGLPLSIMAHRYYQKENTLQKGQL